MSWTESRYEWSVSGVPAGVEHVRLRARDVTERASTIVSSW